jgi:hypothetical protein
VQVSTGLAEEQTWSSFKDEAAARKADPGSKYVDKLHAVWLEMLQLQEPESNIEDRHRRAHGANGFSFPCVSSWHILVCISMRF